MAGFEYERLQIVMDDAVEKKWRIYRNGSLQLYKEVEEMDLEDVVNYFSQEHGSRMVNIYKTDSGSYEMWLEKQENHVCMCKGKEEKTEDLGFPCSFPPGS